MSAEIILLLVGGVLAIIFLVCLYLFLSTGPNNARSQMKSLVRGQRAASGLSSPRQRATQQDQGDGSLLKSAEEARVSKKSSSKLTVRKRLKFAQWKMPVPVFHVCEVVISLIVFAIMNISFALPMQILSLISGPLVMRWRLNSAIDKRFKKFDADYPQMLMSLVGLLKTGMNPMNALEAAAQGLDEASLVRQEIELMITRLRYGVPEDRSIGAFGEDIFHPEIELFVQALLLSRRVGGNLSDTLDRLARQVRKRQYFRQQAVAAVGMQRGSIWFIIAILVGMEIYLYFAFPQAVTGAIQDDVGWAVWQFALALIFLGMFWVRQVTKIKV